MGEIANIETNYYERPRPLLEEQQAHPKPLSRTLFAPVTNALFASLQGLPVGPVTLPTTPLPLTLQARSSPGAPIMQSLALPSAARQRAFR